MLFTNHVYAFGAKESGTFKQVYSAQSNGTSFVVPNNVTSITVKAWGAGGGGGRGGAGGGGVGGPGGGGGFAQGTVVVTPGETLTIYVGGGGAAGTVQSASLSKEGAGGGGHTGVFRGTTPLIIAGAGGGGGGVGDSNLEDGGRGGAGGANTGGAGARASGAGGEGGQGGTQSAGGAGGVIVGWQSGEAGEASGRYRGGGGGNVDASGTGGGAAGGALYGGNGGAAATVTADSGAGGGGGSGYYGGGGGGAGPNSSTGEGGGGGGGGSNYVSGTNTITLQGGVGINGGTALNNIGYAAANTDIDYLSPAGDGGRGGNNTAGLNGNPGRVVLIYTFTDAVVTSVSFVANSISSTASITIPSNAQAGDLAVLFDRASSGSSTIPTSVVPTDFSQIVNGTLISAGFGIRAIFSYKILTASDPGASITGMDGTTNERKILMIFRPSGKSISKIDFSTPNSELTAGTPTSQSLTMTDSSPVIIGIAGWGAGTAVDPRTATGATFVEITQSTSLYTKYCIFNRGEIPTNATIGMDDEGDNNTLQSFYMKIS